MSLERGFKRITLILSLAVGIYAWYSVSCAVFDHWDTMRYQYNDCVAKEAIIHRFWGVWDADGSIASRRERIEFLLPAWSYEKVDVGGKAAWIHAYEIFPGINEQMLSMAPGKLEEAAQAANEKACGDAFVDRIAAESFLAKRSQLFLTTLSIACGVPAWGGGFLGVWLLFFLLRWIGHGFCTTMAQTATEMESRNAVRVSANDSSESHETTLCVCNTHDDVTEGGRQP